MAAVAVVVLWGCAPQESTLPSPRPLVIRSGARLRAEPARMQEIDNWVRIQLDSIRVDPSFLIVTEGSDDPVFMWDGLEIKPDTAVIQVQGVSQEVAQMYNIYAHLHLMQSEGRQATWLPEAPEARGLEFERAVLIRISDAWYYARAIFDAIPYEPLDELLYSNEAGFLDQYIFTLRPEDFPDEREAYIEANPTALDEYRDWFRETFRRLPSSTVIGGPEG